MIPFIFLFYYRINSLLHYRITYLTRTTRLAETLVPIVQFFM